MNFEPNPSLNTVTSLPDSEGEAQRALREWVRETDTPFIAVKKEEIKSRLA